MQYTDTRRRLYISSRTKEFERKVAASSSSYLRKDRRATNGSATKEEGKGKGSDADLELGINHKKDDDDEDRWKIGHLSEQDKDLLRERWASLKIAGRYGQSFALFLLLSNV